MLKAFTGIVAAAIVQTSIFEKPCPGDLPAPTPAPTPTPPPLPPKPLPPWKPSPKGSSPKTVFAHYMMCFHAFGRNASTCRRCLNGPNCGYQGGGQVAGYIEEISYAARYGLDGFALEWLGAEPYYRASYDRIFAACERWNANRPAWAKKPFSLFPIMDTGNWAAFAAQVNLHVNSSCHYRVDGRPFVSAWNGGPGGASWKNMTKVKEHIANYSQVFVPAIQASGHAPSGPFYVPFVFPPNMNGPPDLADQSTILDTFPEMDGLWYWGCADTGDVVSNATRATVEACAARQKYSAAPLSAPYSPHRSAPLVNGSRAWSNVRYFNGNGAKGIITTWEAHIQSQPDFVIYTTWNDLAEHHYLGPYNHTFWGLYPKDDIVWHTSFPHLAYLQLSSYYIRWYKLPAGSGAPAVRKDEEAVFFWYNLQPVHNPCPGDFYGRNVCGDYYPCNATARGAAHCGNVCTNCTWCDDGMGATAEFPVEDMLYVTTLLATPGVLTLESGLEFTKHCKGLDCTGWVIPAAPTPSKTTFRVPAGVHSIKVPLLQGGQRITFTRDGQSATVVGAEGVNTTAFSKDICNSQTFSGVLNLQETLSPVGRRLQRTTDVTVTTTVTDETVGPDTVQGPKTVFAHYMMCFHCFGNCTPGPKCSYQGASKYIEGYEAEMEIAQRHGLDGFALEWLGGASYYNESYYNIFTACEAYNARRGATALTARMGGPVPFALIPMLDGGNYTAVAERLLTHIDSPCLYRFQGRPVVASWGGGINWHNTSGPGNNQSEGAIRSALWEHEVVQPLAALGHARPFFMPFIFPPKEPGSTGLHNFQKGQEDILANFTAMDALWYWGCSDLPDIVANASLLNVKACAEFGKYSVAPVSAPYSAHRHGNNRFYPGNGARGLIQTWMAHINGVDGKQPDFVIYATWNDLVEHHYLGPYNHTFWGLPGENQPVWHTQYPHMAYLQLSAYFARWYKLPQGSAAPPIKEDDESIFFFYRLQPVHNHCPLDPNSPPGKAGYCPASDHVHCSAPPPSHQWCVPDSRSPLGRPGVHNCDADYPYEDMVYVTSLLAKPGSLTIDSGLPYTKPPGRGATGFTIPVGTPSSHSFELPAGLHSVQVPALPGAQRFTFNRAGGLHVSVVGTEGINTTAMSASICNMQTFSGVLSVKPSGTQENELPGDTVVVHGRQ